MDDSDASQQQLEQELHQDTGPETQAPTHTDVDKNPRLNTPRDTL